MRISLKCCHKEQLLQQDGLTVLYRAKFKVVVAAKEDLAKLKETASVVVESFEPMNYKMGKSYRMDLDTDVGIHMVGQA